MTLMLILNMRLSALVMAPLHPQIKRSTQIPPSTKRKKKKKKKKKNKKKNKRVKKERNKRIGGQRSAESLSRPRLASPVVWCSTSGRERRGRGGR